MDVSGGLCNQMMCYKAARLIASWNKTSIVICSTSYQDRSQNPSSHWNFQLHHYPIKYDLLLLSRGWVKQLLSSNSILKVTKEMLYPLNGGEIDEEAQAQLIKKIRDSRIVFIDIWLALFFWRQAKRFPIDREIIQELTLDPGAYFGAEDFVLQEQIFKSKNAVAVHVRRGDFLNSSNDLAVGGCFYNKAMKYLNEKLDEPEFFVFSDDIDWCKVNLSADLPIRYVDHNPLGSGFVDLYLASQCKHFVLTGHSTFSHHMVELNQAAQDRIVISNGMNDLITGRHLTGYYFPEYCTLLD